MGMWEGVLAPLKHMIAESISERAILVRIILIMERYEVEYFPIIKEAKLPKQPTPIQPKYYPWLLGKTI